MRRALPLAAIAVLYSCGDRPAALGAGESQAQPPEPLDEVAVKAMSHAFFDAYDRADERTLGPLLGTAFVSIEEGALPREQVLARVAARKTRAAPPRTRDYLQEAARIGATAAVYRARTVEHFPADGPRAAAEFDGWNTLVWAREAGAWKAVLHQWVRGGVQAERERWNAVYREPNGAPTQPNQLLVDTVAGRPAGRALDIGTGQGRNALFLASKGWRVTGIDISDEGLRQAREAAAARGLTIETVDADVASWDYGVDQWDLAALIYMDCDPKLVGSLRKSLKPGGLVVSERFHRDAMPALGTDPQQLAGLFAEGFDVLQNDVVEAVSDWGGPLGKPQKIVRFVARKR